MVENKPEQKEGLEKKQKRITDCTNAVNKILDEYGCTLTCSVTITPQGNIPRVQVVSK